MNPRSTYFEVAYCLYLSYNILAKFQSLLILRKCILDTPTMHVHITNLDTVFCLNHLFFIISSISNLIDLSKFHIYHLTIIHA